MIYLDHAATSWPKPPRVIEAMTRALEDGLGNPSRAGHAFSVRAERIIQHTRIALSRLFHADEPDRIVLTLNCTDALNIAIKGLLREGDHVITTTLEHNSVVRPLQHLIDDLAISITRIPAGEEGGIDPEAVRRAFTPKTRLIAMLHASNVTGIIQPVQAIGRISREHECTFLVDAAQTAGVVGIDVVAMNIDLLAFPGHKSLLGPTGTGGLYVGPRVSLRPFRTGGTGGDSLRPRQPSELPASLEAGTPNTIGLAGLCAALDSLEPSAALRHEQSLIRQLVNALPDHPRIKWVGNPAFHDRVGVVSLNVAGLAPVDLAAILDQNFAIAVRPGLHCAPGAHAEAGTHPDGTVRVSVGWSTTSQEIDQLVEALRQIAV